MNHIAKIAVLLIVLSQVLFPVQIKFRYFDGRESTRIVFESNSRFDYKIQIKSNSLEVQIPQETNLSENNINYSQSQLIQSVLLEKRPESNCIRAQFKTPFAVKKHFVLEKPFRVVFDLERLQEPLVTEEPTPTPAITIPPPPGTSENSSQDKPEITPTSKKKPIEIICLDPGHGGGDLGAVSKSRVKEKDLTLLIAKKLKKSVEARLGLRVIMTRTQDEETSLNARASIANNQQAQLFVSIHLNSSFRKTAFGSETYFVSLQATDQEALELAQKENKSNDNIAEDIQNDELKLILWNMAQTEYIRESSQLAEQVQAELNDLLDTRNRGVKQAPFRVLMRTAMPSILVEVVFLSNRSEEKRILDDAFQDRVVQALFNGISRFVSEYNQSLK